MKPDLGYHRLHWLHLLNILASRDLRWLSWATQNRYATALPTGPCLYY